MASSSSSSAITMEHMRVALRPKGVAVVGATERVGSVGRTVMDNLLHGYTAKSGKPNPFEVFPVNPTRGECLGLKCYKSVSAIESEACEMVLIITPAARCVDVVRDCALKKSVKVVTVIAAGFKEVGAEGLKLELELVAIAREAGIAVIGPNCLGLMNPNHQLNATFAADSVLPGSVGFISQSGAMCTAFLDYALAVNQGFSAFISIGSMSDVEWSHCIEYLGEDELTKSIMIYMETIGNAGAFMKAAQKVAKKKPIVIIKAGKTEAAAAAAVSHTGSLAGSHDNFLAAMKRAGVLVVDSIDELQSVMMLCSLQPKPCSKSVYIVTNAGGPGVLATDAAAMAGLEVVDLSENMIAEFSSYLPAAWSHANPVDVLGDAKPLTYGKCLETVFKHGEKDAAVLIVLSPQSMTEPSETALAISKVEKEHRGDFKGPVLCAFMGGHQVEHGRQVLIDHSIPSFSQPDRAAQALGLLHRQIVSAEAIQMRETMAVPNAKEAATKVMAAAIAEKREILTESESKAVMKAYGIPVAESIVCQTPEEAISAAKQLQYPCVVKLNSETITHKSDVGGVKLGIKRDEEVIKAFNEIKTNVDKLGAHHFQGVSVQPMLDIASGVELLVGSTSDVQLGPMVLFGTGGCMVEIFKDAAAAVPPLTQADAAQLIASTKISRALVPGHGERFKGCPMNEVEDVLMKFSALICDLNDVIAECEINPLLALQNRVIALDARVVLRTESSTVPVAPPCLL
eukprot:Protomagalhaensia_wolfi_Nauph_80__4589@NODE_472_length_2463_cov_533_578795_g356_i0_p1_GENE_NODE_472_length_2463_cov_533_578795_g356_i0NODE_472_length_2463_cov_533_578795_g356_i0_p1_ORF_typecomplete_len756_score233_51ATPgrasp_5/PF13549_6/7_7e02ATPgrasp_5/PF13549_6/4_4e69Succ_CoA_lig/PF13607_6/7_3e03Succ_CoA_lig/PF13607_6/5_8e45Succ_CoA_lig/PF13607_6/1_8e03CoA_binding_2/PF13380_6/8_9e31CoA_binding_2/PF13380_6/3_1e03ATPgrasp_2/PF08442_10/6_7e09Ligase_CoA/PF00549_19/0_00015Ligase_CoA/PF00549_19/15CP